MPELRKAQKSYTIGWSLRDETFGVITPQGVMTPFDIIKDQRQDLIPVYDPLVTMMERFWLDRDRQAEN